MINMAHDLVKSWARHGMTVNAIAPGWFPIQRSQELPMFCHLIIYDKGK